MMETEVGQYRLDMRKVVVMELAMEILDPLDAVDLDVIDDLDEKPIVSLVW